MDAPDLLPDPNPSTIGRGARSIPKKMLQDLSNSLLYLSQSSPLGTADPERK